MTPWLTIEQRRALRTWALVLAGPALLFVVAWIVWTLTYEFGIVAPLARITWLGTIAETLALLIFIVLATYAAEISIRSLSFKRDKDGAIEGSFSGDEAGGKLQDAGAALIDAGAAVKEQP